MTFTDIRLPLQYVLDNTNQTFGEWVIKRINVLFQQGEEDYELMSVVHFLMKRLRLGYDEILNMDLSVRNELFRIEKTLADKEAEDNK